MQKILRLILAGIAVCGLAVLSGCASDRPDTTTTTTTTEETTVQPAH